MLYRQNNSLFGLLPYEPIKLSNHNDKVRAIGLWIHFIWSIWRQHPTTHHNPPPTHPTLLTPLPTPTLLPSLPTYPPASSYPLQPLPSPPTGLISISTFVYIMSVITGNVQMNIDNCSVCFLPMSWGPMVLFLELFSYGTRYEIKSII